MSEALTCTISGFKEVVDVGYHVFSFNEEEIELKLAVSLIVHFHHQTFASSMAEVQHRPSIKAGPE